MNKSSQSGFNLVEGMVTLVVLSVGMIGIAALYGQSLGAGRAALFRSLAVNLTGDMAERIRSNRSGRLHYGAVAAKHDCEPAGGSAHCSPEQMAEHDLFVWQQEVERLLPNGQTLVSFDPFTDPPSYRIQVSWTEVGFGTVRHEIVTHVPEF